MTNCETKFRALALAAVFFAVAGISLHAQVSLGTVVDLAEKNSSAVKLAQADLDKARASLAESRDVIIPSLDFSTGIPAFPEVGFTGQPPSIFSVTVQSLVFSIPQKHYIDAARSGVNAAIANLKDAREQAALDASTVYIEMDTVNQEMDAARKQQELANRLVDIEQQRAEAGVDPLSALLEARLAAANIKLASLHLETRAATLAKQLAALTALPVNSITPDRASIPPIPAMNGETPHTLAGIEAARQLALSKQRQAKGDQDTNLYPQLAFFAQYNRNTTLLNDVNKYFKTNLPANNFASGFNISVPLLDMRHRAKGHESAAEALRATAEAEQAERQNDVQIAELSGTLRELDAQAEVASLKQQIAAEQLKTVETQLTNGNGATGQQPQLSPKADQLALIDERQKYEDSLEAGLGLAKARLELLRALGHMEDWLNLLHTK